MEYTLAQGNRREAGTWAQVDVVVTLESHWLSVRRGGGAAIEVGEEWSSHEESERGKRWQGCLAALGS